MGKIFGALIKRFMRDQSGSQAIEYTLMVTGTAFALVVGLGLVGTSIRDQFTTIAGYMASGGAAAASQDSSTDSDFGDGDSDSASAGDDQDESDSDSDSSA